MEGPDPEDGGGGVGGAGDGRREGWGQWVRGQLSRAPSMSGGAGSSSCRPSDLRLLLGVMGAPLAPVHVTSGEPLPHLSIKDTPIVSSCFPFPLSSQFWSFLRKKSYIFFTCMFIKMRFFFLFNLSLMLLVALFM